MWRPDEPEQRSVEQHSGEVLSGEKLSDEKPSGEEIVQQLVRLAQRELTGDAPLTRLRLLPEPRAREFPRSALAWALALVAVCAGCWLAFVKLSVRNTPITYRIIEPASGTVVGPSGGSRLRFSEGSEVVLEPGADALVSDLSVNGAKLLVRRGGARFDIRHRANTAWLVQAGPYSVRVTGTEFDVRWSEKEKAFDLSMRSGSVEVTGGDLKAPVRLVAGQSLSKRGATSSTAVRSSIAPAPVADLGAALVTPQAVAAVPLGSARGESSTAASAGSKALPRASAWAQLVAQGRAPEVIRAAEQLGIDTVLATSSLAELSALADAARYVRSFHLAERALLAQRQRFKHTTAARNAAFLLGQLAESRGTAAQAWFETYLREAPDGSYAPQAWGRKMMILYQQSGADRASGIAGEYLARYPSGPYATAARKILSESSSRP